MAYGDIPASVKTRLASERFRMYHAMWHFVRNEEAWSNLPEPQRVDLVNRGWQAPRFENTDGAGIDFLYMHRQMILMVNEWANAGGGGGHHHHGGHGGFPFVQGWLEIPWDHGDPVWPMPVVDLTADPSFPGIFGPSKDPAVTRFYQNRVATEFSDRARLRGVSLDEFGTTLEGSIHGWMHMHWSTEPPASPNSLDETNDWLGSPFSSHVNKHFWKLHGWIDDRILAWQDAHGTEADLSGGWDGPPDAVTGEMHSADPELFEVVKFNELPVLTMPWNDLLLEDEF